jgi:hypothetical protein
MVQNQFFPVLGLIYSYAYASPHSSHSHVSMQSLVLKKIEESHSQEIRTVIRIPQETEENCPWGAQVLA